MTLNPKTIVPRMIVPKMILAAGLAASFALGMIGGATVALAGTAETLELARVYQRVLADPTDTAANLEYARLAEAVGQPRKALATYERVLLYEPENKQAREGLLRIRRKIEPDKTLVTLASGIGYESNPLLERPHHEDGSEGFLNARVEDERRLGDTRWRTVITANGIVFPDQSVLNDAYFGATTGPLLDAGTHVTFNPFIGGGIAGLDGHYYFSEAVGGLGLEGYLDGAYQQLRLKVGYRDYGDSFQGSTHGLYADATGKLTMPDVFTPTDAFVLTPHLRWSDIGSVPQPFYYDDLKPGSYVEWGAKAQYFSTVTDWLTVNVGIGALQTSYSDFDDSYDHDKRRDITISPLAGLTFNKVFGLQSDIAVDYRYDWNRSNDDFYNYIDQVVTAKVVTRF